MFRSKKLVKPENLHSLEYLKYIYTVLSKNQNVNDSNRTLLVESFRSMAEILIWGDQNNPAIFEYFLENNMFNYFLHILDQKCGNYVCVQLLQTLNIIFENIKNKTALYYLLSNNHVNSIIINKLDFSDEDVLAYYISFLKTLSFKLNLNTIHFFYNEATNDFPLYTEAIKFFNHPDSMVRTYVRTLTLNVYRVEDESMLRFIRDKTCAPYFGNLVWFMGKHVLELDASARAKPVDLDTQKTIQDQYRVKLGDLVSSHLDDLHYLNDILSSKVDMLNEVLVDHLMNKLFIPYYIHSLAPPDKYIIVETEEFVDAVKQQPLMNGDICLFLLTQVFLIIHQTKLVTPLAKFLLESNFSSKHQVIQETKLQEEEEEELSENDNEVKIDSESSDVLDLKSLACINITDEEKEILLSKNEADSVRSRCLESIYSQLTIEKSDSSALFGICLLYAISENSGLSKKYYEGFLTPIRNKECTPFVHCDERNYLIDKVVNIITAVSEPVCYIRSVTLEMAITLLKKLTIHEEKTYISDKHIAVILDAKEKILPLLRQFFKKEEMFLELFEDEYNEMYRDKLNVQRLLSDSTLLLPPAHSPMTGIPLSKRLPCGDVEKTRHFICAFLLIRELLMTFEGKEETQLPLVDRTKCFVFDTPINLNGNDLITCMIIAENGSKTRRYLSIISSQLVLVEPHNRFLGWGVCKLSCYLQDAEVTKIDNETKTLHIAMHISKYKMTNTVKLIFDDHIRCNAARQKLLNGRIKARRKQLNQIASLLEMTCETNYAPCNSTQKQKQSLRSRLTDVAVHTSNILHSYPMSMRSTNSDEYSTESNCSSVTHSRDQSPCTRNMNNQECSNSQKPSSAQPQEKTEPKRKGRVETV